VISESYIAHKVDLSQLNLRHGQSVGTRGFGVGYLCRDVRYVWRRCV